jgi:hypothetical protein
MRKNRAKLYVSLALSLPVVGVGAAALAFPFGYSWMQPSHGVAQVLAHDVAGRAGGGGIWGTGSKMDKGIKCSHCHTDPPGLIDAQIDFNPPLSGGTKYVPEQTYQITISLLNEQNLPGPNAMATLNGFALTFEGTDGQRSGVLRSDIAGIDSQSCPQAFPQPAPTNGTSYVYGNCNAIVFVPKNDSTVWYAGWTAPGAGSGQVKMWYAVVDGDHSDKSSLDDDTREGLVTLDEGP